MNTRWITWMRRVLEVAQIELRYAVERWWLAPARARCLRGLRRRLMAQPGASEVGRDEALLARELRQLREELAAKFHHVEACRTCARGHPPPAGRWPGGHCCSGKSVVFTDDELAALRLSGTTGRRLTPLKDDDAGCAFRGPNGCALRPADRPNLCVRYVCTSLELELERRGNRKEIKAMGSEIRTKFARFVALRQERQEAEFLAGFRPQPRTTRRP